MRFVPDVIRISNTYAALFLPIIGGLVNVRGVVVEANPGLPMEEFFPTNVWNVKSLFLLDAEGPPSAELY